MLCFNTNKPHSFFLQNTSCIRKPQVISGRGGAHPLHPPPRSAPAPRVVLGGISGPYISNLFLNDLDMDEHKDITLFKYADDSTVLVTISRDLPDKSEIA